MADKTKTRKHTPGPWGWLDLEKDVSGSFCSDALQGPERTPDVESVAYGGAAQWTGAIVIPNEFDARLIAAAPDLLEAAKLQERASELDDEAHRLSNIPAHNHGDYLALCNEADKFRDKAATERRAAIAKAEGR